jgi:hypothetical protein
MTPIKTTILLNAWKNPNFGKKKVVIKNTYVPCKLLKANEIVLLFKWMV